MLSATLDGVSEMLDEAILQSAETSPVTEMAAALRVVLSGTESADEIHPAMDCLHRAIRGIEAWNLSFWTDNGVLPRARFYLSVLELRLLEPVVAAPAATRLIELLESGLKEPIDLIVDAVNHAVFQDVPDSDKLASTVLKLWPQAVLAFYECCRLSTR